MESIDRKHKDTLFRYIFKESRHFIDLYEVCTGRRLDESGITRFDLNSDVVRRERYNDVSFLTGDNRLLLMIEHQSTISANLAVKLGAYYFDLLKLWAEHNGASIHSGKAAQVPKPEMYVVYNGREPYDREAEVFDCDRFLKIEVPIIKVHYNVLKDKGAGNYLAGYAYLLSEYELGLANGLSGTPAFEQAAENCKARGYLNGIVDKEGFTIMNIDIFSYDSQLRAEGRAEGQCEGRVEGEAKRSNEIARKMLAADEPVEKISLYTGLTCEEIDRVRSGDMIVAESSNPWR